MLQIENLGFLNMACIDNRLSHIFVEPGTQNVKIIYLPVNLAGVHKNKNEFDNEIKAQLVQKIEQTQAADHPQIRQIMDALGEGTLKLHDVSVRIQSEKTEVQRNMIEKPLTNQISIQSMNGQFHFDIQENEFLIGKSREKVQGVITGNSAVSRVHCKIVRKNGNFYVVDMESSNGTYVNGKKIKPGVPEPIFEGCQLRIANAEFIVRG
ncbi:FHA domain-containing protein [Roseburia inulinivorans]|uniref:FHA domain-containing protein n=2 Tax=Roseburia inulinivorans TaxID=360807 RepID=A0A412FBH5_9FIRM|nr:FHA domain-containing protein [Roseburia inulinivorans]